MGSVVGFWASFFVCLDPRDSEFLAQKTCVNQLLTELVSLGHHESAAVLEVEEELHERARFAPTCMLTTVGTLLHHSSSHWEQQL